MAASSVVCRIASSASPISNWMSAIGGSRADFLSSWGVADMRPDDISNRGRRPGGPAIGARISLQAEADSPTIRASFCRPHRMPNESEDAGGLRNTLYKKETRSKRRMTPARRFVWRIVAAIGVFLVKSFWRSCRVVRIVGDEHMAAALAAAPSLIPVYWHQHQLFCAKYLFDQKARGLK